MYIKFPCTREDVRNTQLKFHNIAQFPHVVGVVDGTHVCLSGAPLGEEEYVYVNRKGRHSINVQIISNTEFKITNIVARWPGSTHDSRILQKPIALFGHERSITQIKYNREGDLLFSCAKDTTPNIWFSLNGERLGTFDGHGGAVWCIDVDWETTKAITGSADNCHKMWDVKTGKCIGTLEYKSAVRSNGFSYSSNIFFTSTDSTMGQTSDLCVYDLRDGNQIENNAPFMRIPMDGPKITSAIWTHQDTAILTGHENGLLNLWDVKMQDIIESNSEIHTKSINDLQKHIKYDLVVTASKDNTAKLIELPDLKHLKTYKTERPVNSAAISPLRDHVLVGGGQEAMDVTRTSSRIGKFDACFFHSVFEEEFGKVKGHFGPINSVAFHPDGRGYSSGGEDGYVRVHTFDPQYYDFEFEY